MLNSDQANNTIQMDQNFYSTYFNKIQIRLAPQMSIASILITRVISLQQIWENNKPFIIYEGRTKTSVLHITSSKVDLIKIFLIINLELPTNYPIALVILRFK